MLPFRLRHADRIVAGFVLFGFVATAALLLVAVKNQGIFQRRVRFHTVFDDAGGIKPETPVKLAGLEVGSVRSVRLTPDDRVEVTFEILEQYRDRIVADPPGELCQRKAVVDMLLDAEEKQLEQERKEKCGTRVSVGLPAGLGAFLQAGLELHVGNKKTNPPVPDDSFVPAEQSEGLNELFARLQKEGFVQNARDIIVQVDTLLKSLNAPDGAMQQTLANVQAATSRLASGKGLVGELTRDDSPAMKSVQQSLQRLDNTLARLEAASHDVANVTSDVAARRASLVRFVQNLDDFSVAAKQTGLELEGFMKDARHVPPDVNAALQNFDARIDDLGDVLRGIKRAVPFGLGEDEEKKRLEAEKQTERRQKRAGEQVSSPPSPAP